MDGGGQRRSYLQLIFTLLQRMLASIAPSVAEGYPNSLQVLPPQPTCPLALHGLAVLKVVPAASAVFIALLVFITFCPW